MSQTTCLYLVRHGRTDYIGRALAGRLPGVHLNEAGQQEAERIRDRLAGEKIRRILCSPLERTEQTARPLAEALGLEVERRPELHEVDFGSWSGQDFATLGSDPGWDLFNRVRSVALTPAGDSLLGVQLRMTGFLQRLHREEPGLVAALFGHADPIKSVLMYYLGMPVDHLQRLEISPGSISLVELSDLGPRVLLING
jgi:ribonuclease H / adenosylcobalamin/alpha-ribazole phosphatase